MKIEALTKAGFAAFGDVVEFGDVKHFPINQGFAERFNDLAHVDVNVEGGSVNISLLIANPRPKPIAIKVVERHPLGSQIFYPLQDRPWLVVACADPKDHSSFRCFRATGQQGINYRRNAWHHALLVLEAESRFMIVDRKGPGINLEEAPVDEFRLDLP